MKEDEHHITFIKWMKEFHPHLIIFHIPNGGSRHKIEAVRLKAMGVKPGVADLYVMNYHLFIEMKTEKGKLSSVQTEFKNDCERTHHSYFTAYGFKDAVLKFNFFNQQMLQGMLNRVNNA